MSKNLRDGFTIVELLIVIVVIAILATLATVSYNGLQKRAQESAAKADFQSMSRKVLAYQSVNNIIPTYAQFQSDATTSFTINSSIYKALTYCYTDTKAAIGAELQSGDKYYQQVGQVAIRDNSVDVASVCAQLGIVNAVDGSAATVSYLVGTPPVVWTYCANEGQMCSFSGVRTVRYGANGTYNYRTNVSGSISCANSIFGDPTPGVVKRCDYQ